ncbi:hypothetical protein AVME950_20545 [Acidovorax sp. SUPP950]|uniref:hypothetical protein n=1 Tax=Acidovorax sp. SUPP950 TaxID=511901 RepID=UPI0023CFA321|nr:hypothetical protein [Acidovorax sp. SUPP950]GKS77327.1 hypothetical protein AVME950_20545 [Acidovorax sp. SUPP950]
MVTNAAPSYKGGVGRKKRGGKGAKVTFIEQDAPIDEYGRGLYAVSRSVLRALIDSLSDEDLTDLCTPLDRVTMRQLAKVVRLDRDQGMRGDGFEWAVHEVILGGEPQVIEPVHHALRKCSRSVKDAAPNSILFGYERAKYLGFLNAAVTDAGADSFILPDGQGRPFRFGKWVAEAARGKEAEADLGDRIKQIWKTDLFLSSQDDVRHFAATVKSNYKLLEGGRGLRVGIVPESKHRGNRGGGVRYDDKHGLWVVSLADPNGFMGLFSDAYHAVGRAMCTLGKQSPPPYYTKPSAKAQVLQAQLEKYPAATALEIEDALNDAAQQKLVKASHELIGVNAPDWLHIKEMAPKIISPKPIFRKLD